MLQETTVSTAGSHRRAYHLGVMFKRGLATPVLDPASSRIPAEIQSPFLFDFRHVRSYSSSPLHSSTSG